ncbi:MAG: hypothetical protein AB1297_08130, partial [bacterium]
NLKSVLKIEGETKGIGKEISPGSNNVFTLKFNLPGWIDDMVSYDVTSGAYYGIGIDLQNISSKLLEDRATKLEESISLVNQGEVVGRDNIAGEILYQNAIQYFSGCDVFNRLLAKLTDIVWIRQPSAALTAMDVSVSYLYSIPYSLEIGGMYIDVKRDVITPFSQTGNQDQTRAFMIASGAVGSAMEHNIFEQIYNVDSISAVKVIQIANERGIPIYSIDKNNIGEILPQLQVSSGVKNDIQNAIAANKIVIIPQTNIQYHNWNGTGYIVIDPDTGAGAYLISGGMGGGSTAVLVDWLVQVCLLLLGLIPIYGAIPGFISIWWGIKTYNDAISVINKLEQGGKLTKDQAEMAKGFFRIFLYSSVVLSIAGIVISLLGVELEIALIYTAACLGWALISLIAGGVFLAILPWWAEQIPSPEP